MLLDFEWAPHKEEINIQKHGLDFKTAVRIFQDPLLLELYDETHSSWTEDRYQAIGRVESSFLVLTVIFTERKDAIRIISARRATKEEVKQYYDSEIYS